MDNSYVEDKITQARNNICVAHKLSALSDKYVKLTNNTWNTDTPPTVLTPSVADILEIHEMDSLLTSRYEKYAHISINNKQLFEFIISDNDICKALSWCRCVLAEDTINKEYAHEHWHVLIKYKYGVRAWKNSKSISNYMDQHLKHLRTTSQHKLFFTIKQCTCSSPLNGIIHYIGCSTGQMGKHIHLDRHNSWHHDRHSVRMGDTVTSKCMMLMKGPIETTYQLRVHSGNECPCNSGYKAKIAKHQRVKKLRKMNGHLAKNKEGPQPDPIKLQKIVTSVANSLVSLEYNDL
jgi:hypothetical protein